MPKTPPRSPSGPPAGSRGPVPQDRARGKGARRDDRAPTALSAQRRSQRRATLAWRGGLGLLAVLGVGFLVWLGTSGPSPGSPASAATAPVANDYGQPGDPPWPAPADPTPGAQAAGIPLSGSEGTAQHFHAHLDVIVDGRAVPVPADLGIDETGGRLGALHTHDASGVLHVESPSPNNHYILGQLFNEWNVRLDPTAIGGLAATGGNALTAYVNGQKVEGNPAAIPLTPHAEIALIYGPPAGGPPPPATYNFGEL